MQPGSDKKYHHLQSPFISSKCDSRLLASVQLQTHLNCLHLFLSVDLAEPLFMPPRLLNAPFQSPIVSPSGSLSLCSVELSYFFTHSSPNSMGSGLTVFLYFFSSFFCPCVGQRFPISAEFLLLGIRPSNSSLQMVTVYYIKSFITL